MGCFFVPLPRLHFENAYLALFLLSLSIVFGLGGSRAADAPVQVTARAIDAKDYGRLIFSFSQYPEISSSVSRGVIVLSFDRPIDISTDRLTIDLPNWISAARLDPDRKALRLGLAKAARPNLTEAGNELYFDLLPESWKGAPPALPTDVIRELSRKARAADAAKREELPTRSLLIDTATSNKLSRLIIRGAAPAALRVNRKDQIIELEFLGDYDLDLARLRAELPAGFKSTDVEKRDGKMLLRIQIENGVTPDARVEDGAAIIDAIFHRSTSLESARVAFSTVPTDASPQAPAQQDQEKSGIASELPQISTGFSLNLLSGLDGPRLILISPNPLPLATFSRAHSHFFAIETDIDPDMNGLQDAAKGIAKIKSFRAGKLFVIRFDEDRVRFPVMEPRNENRIALSFSSSAVRPKSIIEILPQRDDKGHSQLLGLMAEASTAHIIDDPDFGDRIIVVPTTSLGHGSSQIRHFPEVTLLQSAQGLALVPLADDLDVTIDNGLLTIKRPMGLALSGLSEVDAGAYGRNGLSVISRARWERDEATDFVERRNYLTATIADAPETDRFQHRLTLARFLAAHNLFPEAAAAYSLALELNGIEQPSPRDRLELAIYLALSGNMSDARATLSDPMLAKQDEANLWRSYLDSIEGHDIDAVSAFRRSAAILGLYPENLRRIFRMQLLQSALEIESTGIATQLLNALIEGYPESIPERLSLYHARLDDITGNSVDARPVYDHLSSSKDTGTEVKARFYKAAVDLKEGRLAPEEAVKIIQTLTTIWRGDPFEARMLMTQARAAISAKDWKSAFTAAQRLNRIYVEIDGVRPLLEDFALRFDGLLSGEGNDKIDSFETVALFLDFREFMPVGRRGDELTSKLIERLVDLDLIPQATDLLKYQISFRLPPIQKPVAALELAELYLRDKKPIEAIRAIADTRSGGLDEETRRARRLIEASARAELGEIQASIDLLEGLDDREASRLRGDIYWKAKSYLKAANAYEIALSGSWRDDGPMVQDDSALLLRSAISYVLANDSFGVERIRNRYLKRLESTPDAPAFRLLTTPASSRDAVAAALADTVSNTKMLDQFLQSYRKRYIDKETKATSDAASDINQTQSPG